MHNYASGEEHVNVFSIPASSEVMSVPMQLEFRRNAFMLKRMSTLNIKQLNLTDVEDNR